MRIDDLSCAAGSGPNEDFIAVYRHGEFTDIVILDGGSSVADQDYVDSETGDVAWFVKRFSLALEKVVRKDRPQSDSVMLALAEVRTDFCERTSGCAVPLYALPIAAMTWIRATPAGSAHHLEIYCVGDCTTLLQLPDKRVVDLDPYVNPQESILQDEIARLANEGIADAATRRARLMPMLRARREFMNSTDAPFVLCLAPRGPLNARAHAAQAEPGSMLLAMTDGFYRLVDTYHLDSNETLADSCQRQGLAAVMQALREFERYRPDGASGTVKNADDASAVTCLFE